MLDHMTSSHPTADGSWVACEDPARCAETIHLPDLDPATVAALPQLVLLQLIEVVDPYTNLGVMGEKRWADAADRTHRAYDLPAVIFPNGDMAWWQHGKPYRVADRPTATYIEGTQEWYDAEDESHREDGPASIYQDEYGGWHGDWYTHGRFIKTYFYGDQKP